MFILRFVYAVFGLSVGLLASILWSLQSPPSPPSLQIFPRTGVVASPQLDNDDGNIRARLTRRIFPEGMNERVMPDETIHLDNGDDFLFTFTDQHKFVFRSLLLVPENARDTLLIWHGGHEPASEVGRGLIAPILKEGYPILVLSMPGFGHNEWPDFVHHPQFGTVSFKNSRNHDLFSIFENEEDSAISLFMEPILRSVNAAIDLRKPRRMVMAGLSGGGWSTTLYASLDRRIDASVSVAGSLPISVRSINQVYDVGDWEQYGADIYRIANYPDLYVLAAEGGREHVHVLNGNDPCCFAANSGGLEFAQSVIDAVQKRGGTYRLIVDKEHDAHSVSKLALGEILSALHGPSTGSAHSAQVE